MYKQGNIVAVKLSLGIEHYGIVTGSGTVISASKRTGRVVEEDYGTFSGGLTIVNKGYPSTLAPREVVANARKSIGRKWKLISDNCQHFATECHGIRHSPQLQAAVVGVVLVAGAWLLIRSKN